MSVNLLAVAPITTVILHYAKIVKFHLPFSPIRLKGRSFVFATNIDGLVNMAFVSPFEDHCQLILAVWGGRLDSIQKATLRSPLATGVSRI